MFSVVQAMYSSSMIHNRVSSVFPLRRWSVAVLLLATFSLYGCTSQLRSASSSSSNFYQSGHGNTLLPGEKVLFYTEGYNNFIFALTDERILHNTVPEQRWRPSYPSESVDLANIRQIGWHERRSYIQIELYGELGTVDIYYSWDDERITQAIQAQVDYINSIRNELGISIPESVTTSELNKLNESVIAELRARRKKAVLIDSERLEKDASAQNECPDINGIYYDRSVYSYKWKDEPSFCRENIDWMPPHCSLTTWLNLMASGIRNYQVDLSPSTSSCPPARVIELVSEDVLKKITVMTYRDDVVFNKFTIDSESMGYRCEEGRLLLDGRISLYKNDDGLLEIEDSTFELLLVAPLPPIPLYDVIITRWGEVMSASNPYIGCKEVDYESQDQRLTDDDLTRELERITDAYTNNRMSKRAYNRMLNYLIIDYGKDRVQKAISELGKSKN